MESSHWHFDPSTTKQSIEAREFSRNYIIRFAFISLIADDEKVYHPRKFNYIPSPLYPYAIHYQQKPRSTEVLGARDQEHIKNT
jgi:hypothetical protein